MARKKGIVKSVFYIMLGFVVVAGGVAFVTKYIDNDESCTHENQTELEAVSPTCMENGKTEGIVCVDCGEVLVEQKNVLALGHTEKAIEAVSPTCTENGLTAGKVCEDCGEVIVAQETVFALGHNYVNGICARCEDGTGYIDTLAPTGYMYQKPSLNEMVCGNVYRLGTSDMSIYMSLTSTVANKVFGVYGNHLGDSATSYATNARFFTLDGYNYVEFPTEDFFIVIDGVKYTDNAVIVTGIDTIVSTTTTSATRLVPLDSHFELWQTDGANLVMDESKIMFTAHGPAGIATKNTYTNFELTFDVIENTSTRTYYAVGIGAPTVGAGTVESAFIQFNYDQLYIRTIDGTELNYWNQSRSWTISVTDGYLTLVTGEGEIVCQNLALGVTSGHVNIQADENCNVTLDNVVMHLYK